MQQGYNIGAHSPLVMLYPNKYFHSFFSSVFTSTTEHIRSISYSLRKPKERIKRRSFII